MEKAWATALRALRSRSGADVAFAGTVDNDRFMLQFFDGARSRALSGLEVDEGRGLGGRVWQARELHVVNHYSRATNITHDYDQQVQAEGLQSVVGVPVLVAGRIHGVLYAGSRTTRVAGDRFCDEAIRSSSWLASELAREADVQRRVDEATRAARAREAAVLERLRSVHAHLRRLGAMADNPASRAEIERIEQILSCDTVNGPSEAVSLTARERDIMTELATGDTYGAIADRLGLTAGTVKSYVRDVRARLDVKTRHEAVVRARQLGLIP